MVVRVFKDVLYKIVTSTGILLTVLNWPYVGRWVMWILLFNKKPDTIADGAGKTMKVTKYTGKIFPPFKPDTIANMKSLPIRNDDVLLCGFPKTGCHWLYEIVRMITSGSTELSAHGKIVEGMLEAAPQILLDSVSSPRVLNTHVHYEELPNDTKEKKTKIVFSIRCPKDTVVSYYNHLQLLKHNYNYDGSFENYFQMFMAGNIEYGSYFDYLLAWDKVRQCQKDNSMMVVDYNCLREDTLRTVKEIARFLDVDITDAFARRVVEKTDINNMKKKFPNNKLIYKGKKNSPTNCL